IGRRSCLSFIVHAPQMNRAFPLSSHEFFQSAEPSCLPYILVGTGSGRELRSSGIYAFRSQHCTAIHIRTVRVQQSAGLRLAMANTKIDRADSWLQAPGLSVLPVEVLRTNNPLLTATNYFVTPHIA